MNEGVSKCDRVIAGIELSKSALYNKRAPEEVFIQSLGVHVLGIR